jgi:spore germination cell wall hydrolase CwlJ-like protein
MVLHGKPKQQAARDLSEDDLFCMIQNVYHESRGEDALGQAAVAHVTLNRVCSSAYPDTVCGVVWQKGQFSWTEDGKSDHMTDLGRGARPCRKCAMKRTDRMGGNPCWPYQEAGKPLGLSVTGRSVT